MKQRVFKVIGVIILGLCSFLTYLPQVNAAEIPYGAGGYCWGVSADQMPNLNFLMNAGTSAISVYEVGDLSSYNLGDYLPDNIKPKEIRVLCSTNRGYFEMQMNYIDVERFERITDYLTAAYGIPKVKESESRNAHYYTFLWENENTCIRLVGTEMVNGKNDLRIDVSHK